MRNYDAVVIGAGVFGAWIAYRLRRSGKTVALVDAYGPGNSRSSSGGESRVIRMSYGADEIYGCWSVRSLKMWTRIFREANEPRLFDRTGVLWTAPEGDARVKANQESLTENRVSFLSMSYAEVQRHFPQIRFSWPVTGIFELDSGVLLARRCVQAVVRVAQRFGVDYVETWGEHPIGRGRVDRISIGSGKSIGVGEVIYACGPWLPKLFPEVLGGRIRVTRQEVFYFGTDPGDRRFTTPDMPVWLDYTDPRGAYSIPNLESRGFKLAFDRHGAEVDPDTQQRVVSAESIEFARSFLRERFPGLGEAPVLETRVCQYENTSNGDFLIDRHPDFENVWLVGGGSGHGFKHGPAVGEYVEQLLAGSIPAEPRFALASKGLTPARTVY